MEVNKILQADVLDIIFEGRNKDYGAYDLRKTYNRRLVKALLGVALLLLSLLLGYAASNLHDSKRPKPVVVEDIDLAKLQEEKKNDPPPPPPPKVEPPKVAMTQFTTIKIVKDQEVKPDEKPPEQKDLDDTKIGNVNQDGVKDDGIPAPAASDGNRGIVEAPKDNTDYEQTFTSVQIESTYPGDMPAWQRYLNKNFRYPEDAQSNEIQGTVMVKFIVDKEGNVSDVEAISGPETGGLREEAVRVIKKSGKWNPAIQNGRQVKSYKSQPIIFRIEGQ
jgi:protein TonB